MVRLCTSAGELRQLSEVAERLDPESRRSSFSPVGVVKMECSLLYGRGGRAAVSPGELKQDQQNCGGSCLWTSG